MADSILRSSLNAPVTLSSVVAVVYCCASVRSAVIWRSIKEAAFLGELRALAKLLAATPR